MFNFLPKALVGVLATCLLLINVLFWCSLLLSLALIKVIIPLKIWHSLINPLITKIAEAWVWCNSGWMALTQKTQWDVKGLEGLNNKGWYLVNSNHQSWFATNIKL